MTDRPGRIRLLAADPTTVTGRSGPNQVHELGGLCPDVAAILEDHARLSDIDDAEWSCRCGQTWQAGGTHAAHVASSLVSRMGWRTETRTLEDGAGGLSTDYRTGQTTVHSRPATRQLRWVSRWENLRPGS